MLALRTGWTDRTIADGIGDDFRRACHAALYAELLAERLTEARQLFERADAIDITTIPTDRRSAIRAAQQSSGAVIAYLRASMGLDAEVLSDD